MTHLIKDLLFFFHFPGTFQEVIPMILPFFHIYGLNAVALQNLTFGSKIITIPKFLPELFVNVIEKNKVNYYLLCENKFIYKKNKITAQKPSRMFSCIKYKVKYCPL